MKRTSHEGSETRRPRLPSQPDASLPPRATVKGRPGERNAKLISGQRISGQRISQRARSQSASYSQSLGVTQRTTRRRRGSLRAKILLPLVKTGPPAAKEA
ncbi:hypothetical protein ACOMHN_008866 [Nucella lapillus]